MRRPAARRTLGGRSTPARVLIDLRLPYHPPLRSRSSASATKRLSVTLFFSRTSVRTLCGPLDAVAAYPSRKGSQQISRKSDFAPVGVATGAPVRQGSEQRLRVVDRVILERSAVLLEIIGRGDVADRLRRVAHLHTVEEPDADQAFVQVAAENCPDILIIQRPVKAQLLLDLAASLYLSPGAPPGSGTSSSHTGRHEMCWN